MTEVTGAVQKSAICDAVLRALPDWFGIEQSIVDYVREVQPMPFYAVHAGELPVGFVALKVHNRYTAEVYVMGVLARFHRQGVGKALIQACEAFCRARGIEFLTVKTLAASRAHAGYAKTRAFYHAMGFRPLEVFPALWDPQNPCLFLAKRL